MDRLILYGIAFFIITLIGFYLAYLYGRKTNGFRWNEYLAIIICPLLFILWLAVYVNPRIIILFISSAFIGLVLEYILGITYHKVENQKLWHYNDRFSINGYTSYLTLPIWGVAGVMGWFLSKIIGL